MKIFKIKIIFLICFLIIRIASAQEVKVEIGPQIKLGNFRNFPDLLFGDETGYYLWSRESKPGLFTFKQTFFLDKLDKHLNLESSKEFISEDDDVYDEGTKYFGGQIVWMISDRDKKADRITYKATPISKEGKASKPVVISRFKFEKRKDIPITNWHFNLDTTKLLFLAESDNNSKKEDYNVHIASIDSNLKKLWDKNIKFSKTENQVTLLNQELNSDGEVFLLYKIYEDRKKESKNKKPAYDIELLYVKNDTDEVKKYKLELKNSFIKSANLKLRNNGEMYCVGLYSNTVDGPTHGVFYMKLIEGEVVISTIKPFSPQDIEKLGNKKTEKDRTGEEGLNDNFLFKSLEILDDGSTFVTVEPNYKKVYRNTNSRGISTGETIVYHSEDIIIINILPDGEINRLSILPKNQKNGERPDFLSHASFSFKNKIFLFYNEDEDNYKNPIGSKPKVTAKYKDFVATMTTLNKEGEFERKALFEYDDTNSILIPSNISKFGKNKYFFVTVQRKFLTGKGKFTFGTIQLKDVN